MKSISAVADATSLPDVVAAIGYSATLSLIHVYAGGRVYVPLPSNLTEAHPLARLLGMPLALKLAQAIGGGDPLRVPSSVNVIWQQREEEIVRRSRDGVTVTELARAYGVTERYVYGVRARAKASGRL